VVSRASLPIACRLYVILARAAPVAVVFRRGPARRVQIVKWSTDTDTFEEGQWFHGRIYERRCDLSPDGSRLVYFAQKINPRTMDSTYSYSWTAVSKLPFLTALALWPKGDCWGGGGLFKSGWSLLLNHPLPEAKAHPDHLPPKRFRVSSGVFSRGEDEPILAARMTRDGWKLAQSGRYPWKGGRPRTERVEIWTRESPNREATLVQSLDALDFKAWGGPYITSFLLRRPGRPDIPITGARWADWDQAGRVVFARDGCLFTGAVRADGLHEKLLVDLNSNKPRSLKAPEWATQW
jgi:hypothetical protein